MKVVKQLCPLSEKVSAIYYDKEEKGVWIWPIDAIAIYDDVEDGEIINEGLVGYICIGSDGSTYIDEENTEHGFLGYYSYACRQMTSTPIDQLDDALARWVQNQLKDKT